MDIARADFIEGMAKGMAVLESFNTERQRLNATLAAQRAGITRSAARRHLLTLAHLGYLESEDGYYWLSPKVLRFSGSYLASARLPRVLQPTLNRLAAQTQQSFSCVVLDGDQVVIVARSVGFGASYLPATGSKAQAAAPRVLAYGLHLGARLPAHATSTGRMLLACLPRAAFSAWMKSHELPRLTPHTVTEAKAFRAIVAEAGAQDYCVASQAHELGVFALAVPLRNMRGATVAALNVVTAPERLEPAVLEGDLLPLLLDAARELRPLL
jgi:IclR family transcriptional regulator, pca regulon regulatory protein